MKKMNLYEGSTGDLSVTIFVWAKSKAKAIKIMNKEYRRHVDEGEKLYSNQ